MFSRIRWLKSVLRRQYAAISLDRIIPFRPVTAALPCSQTHVLQAVTLLVTYAEHYRPLTAEESVLIAKMLRRDWPLSELIAELRQRRRLPPLPADFDWNQFRV